MARDAYDERTELAARRRRFCSRLLAAADSAGYRSIAELSEETGISSSALNYYLSGRREWPSTVAAMRLARALGVPLDWLLGGEEDELLRGILRAREIERARVGGRYGAWETECAIAQMRKSATAQLPGRANE